MGLHLDRDTGFLLAFLGIVGIGILAVAVASSGDSTPRSSGRLRLVERGYSNLEEWEIIRDSRGRTVGVRAHRKVEPNIVWA